MGDFTKLKVWQFSKNISIAVYKLINESPKLLKDFGLRDQLQRSAVSIPSNIAEGEELDTLKQGIRHFYIAKGSCAELITQLIIAKEIEVVDKVKANDLIEKTNIVSVALYKLIQARKSFIK